MIIVDLMVTRLTNFSEAFVLIDSTVQSDGGVSGLLQKCICWVSCVSVFLDGLQEEGVAGDPLHRHHQEETQRCGVYFRPGEMNGNNEQSGTKIHNCYMLGRLFSSCNFRF